MFRKPNFFIIGAPKCGTTSLAVWLGEHSNVFMTTPKEPEFFNNDIAPLFKGGLRKYESLFQSVSQSHIAIGEGSTVYLRSVNAISNILSYQPDARFVIGVRNPIDMVISWHGQMLRNGWESENNFERAWHMQSTRALGNNIPALCPDWQHLMYGNVCKLGSQLERLYSLVQKDRCFVYTLDDMKEDPEKLWKDVLTFLGVPVTRRNQFPVINEGMDIPKWLTLTGAFVHYFKQRIGLRWVGYGLIDSAKKKLSKKNVRTNSPEFINELKGYFRKDVTLLGELTGRDFSGWLENGAGYFSADNCIK